MNGSVVNGSNGNGVRKHPVRIAFETAVVIWVATFLTVLIAALPGFPTASQVYAAVVISGSFGVASYATARGIKTGV